MKRVSVCIVNHNDKDTILDTLRTLKEHTKGVELTIYVSDNQSRDGSAEAIEEKFSDVVVLKNEENRGFGAGNNAVLPFVDGNSDYLALVNPDIEIKEDVLTKMTEYLDEHEDVGMLSPKILNMDGTVQHLPKLKPRFIYLLSGRLPFLKKFRDHFTMADRQVDIPVEVDFCTGCFMFLRTDLFVKLKGFDERYFLYLEDADLTREVQRFQKTVYHPDIEVFHHWHRSSGKSLKFLMIHISSMFKYFWKWRGKK